MQLCFPFLRESGWASVLSFVSGSALAGIAYTAPYSAAKVAVATLTKVAANRVGSLPHPSQRGVPVCSK
ncbi:hypothetical protein [Mycobacterium tilburgii]|uniref:hypothetical protein n=1 Tax=Mycobacterium tilburgii TaxID=44467 RepID=UPI0021B3BE18|nr:hypothetical protein [Mycobacterium tilburgii]